MGGDSGHHSDHSKKKLKFLFKRPSPINAWGEQTLRGETWIELFMDLFYVAFLLKLGDLFHSCGLNTSSVVYAASVFLGVYMAKFHLDQYINKFGTEDLVHKVFFTLYSAGLFIMTLSVNDTAEQGADADGGSSHRLLAASSSNKVQHFDCPEYRPYIIGFTVGWMITRGTILLMFCSIYYFVRPQGKFVFYAKAPIIIASMVIMMGNFLVEDYHHYYHSYFTMAAGLVEYLGWGIWEVILFGTWLMKNHGLKAMIPVNIHHHSARTSAFLMIVLGEAIIALLTPLLHPEVHVWTYTLLGFLLIFTLALLYFDTNPTHHEPHALSISRISGTVWVLAHPFLAFFLFGVGIALKLTYEDLREDLHRVTNQQILGVFLGLSIFSMTLIRVCHKVRLTIGGTITVMTRFIIAGLHVVVGYILSDRDSNDFSDEAKLMIHCFLNFVLLALDIYKYRELDREEHLKQQEMLHRIASSRAQSGGAQPTSSSPPDRSSLTRQFLSSTLIAMPYAEQNDRYRKRHSLRSIDSVQSTHSATNGRQQRHPSNFFALSPDDHFSASTPCIESKSSANNGIATEPASYLGEHVIEMVQDPSSESAIHLDSTPVPEATPSVASIDVPSVSSIEKFREGTYRRSKSMTASEDGSSARGAKPIMVKRHSTVDSQRGKLPLNTSAYHVNDDGQVFVRKGSYGLIPAGKRAVRKTADKNRPMPPLALTQPPLPSEADASEMEGNTFVELSSVQTSEMGGIEVVEGEEEFSEDDEVEILYDNSATASHVTWL